MKKLLVISLLLAACEPSYAEQFKITTDSGVKSFETKAQAILFIIESKPKIKSIVETRDVVFKREKLSFVKAKQWTGKTLVDGSLK